MGALAGVCEFLAVPFKANTKRYQIVYNLPRGTDHDFHRIGIVFVVSGTHGIFIKGGVIIFVTKYADTALCQIRVAFRSLVLRYNNDVFIFRQI